MKAITGTLILLVVCTSAATLSHAQVVAHSSDSTKKNTSHTLVKPKGPKPISHEVSLGLRLNSDGWSIYSDIGKVKTQDIKHSDMFYNIRFWQVELTEKKSPNEQKKTSNNGSGTNSYIYGKINNFYALKLGYGFRKMIAGKPDPGSVSIHWVNAGGVSVGFVKPYYINVYSDPTAVKYSDATKQDFLNEGLIEGSAGFSKGLSEVTVVPGFHFKSALHFDFSANRKNVIGIETGMNVEYYTSNIQLLANQTPVPYFFDIFIAAQFGRRW
jgi:hypothetical protein